MLPKKEPNCTMTFVRLCQCGGGGGHAEILFTPLFSLIGLIFAYFSSNFEQSVKPFLPLQLGSSRDTKSLSTPPPPFQTMSISFHGHRSRVAVIKNKRAHTFQFPLMFANLMSCCRDIKQIAEHYASPLESQARSYFATHGLFSPRKPSRIYFIFTVPPPF